MTALTEQERLRIRQEKAKPLADALHAWLIEHKQRVPLGATTARIAGSQCYEPVSRSPRAGGQ